MERRTVATESGRPTMIARSERLSAQLHRNTDRCITPPTRPVCTRGRPPAHYRAHRLARPAKPPTVPVCAISRGSWPRGGADGNRTRREGSTKAAGVGYEGRSLHQSEAERAACGTRASAKLPGWSCPRRMASATRCAMASGSSKGHGGDQRRCGKARQGKAAKERLKKAGQTHAPKGQPWTMRIVLRRRQGPATSRSPWGRTGPPGYAPGEKSGYSAEINERH
jgi:hypothetical protein